MDGYLHEREQLFVVDYCHGLAEPKQLFVVDAATGPDLDDVIGVGVDEDLKQALDKTHRHKHIEAGLIEGVVPVGRQIVLVLRISSHVPGRRRIFWTAAW